MKNLIIAATPYFSDRGCHIRIFLEAKYLQKKGVKNILCTYHLGRDVGDFEIERISNVSWYRKTSPGFAWGKIWLDFKLLLLCIQEIKKNRPDVIHAHLYEGLAIGWLAKYLTGDGDVPVILDLQGDLKNELSSYNGKNNSIVKNILVWISNKMINLANVTVVSSENALKLISKKFKSKKDLFVVKDGIDLNLFDKNIEKNLDKKIKKELDQIKRWKGSEKVLVYTGGMEEGKGVRELLEEFLKSRNKLNGWKLLLYGSGSKREFYQKMIEKEEAQDMVWFAEEVGFFALPFFLKLADVAIDPKKSSTESSGKLMSYMAGGVPVICFDNKFNKERLGGKGFYLKNISELKSSFKNKSFSKTVYNLNNESEEKEVDKLFKIFNDLI